MSFERYWEYKCRKGHEYAWDVYDHIPSLFCPICNEMFTHKRLVDMTNGIDEDQTYEDVAGPWSKTV